MQNMKQTILTIILLFVTSICYGDKFATLSAPSGHFEAVDVGEASQKIVIDAKVKITSFDRSAEWPPAAYVGFYDKNDPNNKFQFLIIRNKGADNHVIAGYRVIEEGKEVSVAPISYYALDETVEHTLKYSSGKVVICLSGHKLVEIATNLHTVVPYISVSSGEAKFEVALNKQRNTDSSAIAPPPVR